MPQRLIDPTQVVPMDGKGRHFRYTHFETGYVSSSPVYNEVVQDYLKHRKANGLPIPENYEQEIQNQLCSVLPPGFCTDGAALGNPITLTIGDVRDAMKIFAKWALRGFKPVPQEEANRRADICSRCYRRSSVPGCAACARLYALLEGIFAKLTTPFDAQLDICGVCKCVGKAQVHVPLDILDEKDSPEKQAAYPEHCWLLKGGSNRL